MKKFLIIALVTTLSWSCEGREESVDNIATLMDDAVFIAYCYENFDLNEDGKISIMEADAVKYIHISNSELKSVKGISLFKNLEDISFKGSGLQSINLSYNEKLTTIGDYAFFSCTSLKEVIIPTSVTSIGNYAFSDCRSLPNVRIPNSVTSIGDNAFSECIKLRDIDIPNSVTSIGDGAFYHCDSMETLDVEHYHGRPVLTSIGDAAFAYCLSLERIYIPYTVTSMGSLVFANCISLKDVKYSSHVLGQAIFQNCNKLKELSLAFTDITSIENRAFEGCCSLEKIFLPWSVTSIESKVFAGCSSLCRVVCLAETPPNLSDDRLFHDADSNLKICVPDSEDDSIINAYKNSWANYANHIYELSY